VVKLLNFFKTGQGYFGLSGVEVQAGDIVCVLPGATNPFVLRHQGDSYQLVDYCFAHGMMYGEMVDLHRKGYIPLEKIQIV
jgi:hypothetical protein